MCGCASVGGIVCDFVGVVLGVTVVSSRRPVDQSDPAGWGLGMRGNGGAAEGRWIQEPANLSPQALPDRKYMPHHQQQEGGRTAGLNVSW